MRKIFGNRCFLSSLPFCFIYKSKIRSVKTLERFFMNFIENKTKIAYGSESQLDHIQHRKMNEKSKSDIRFTAVSRRKQLDFDLQNCWTFELISVLATLAIKACKSLWNQVIFCVKRISDFIFLVLLNICNGQLNSFYGNDSFNQAGLNKIGWIFRKSRIDIVFYAKV